jgi:Leucine-rich repeat (LRR) protein
VALDQLTDTGLKSLGKLANLEELDLYGNSKMTDNGLKALTNLRSLRNLRLGKQCLFTDRGISYLASLPSLKVLWLDTHNITDEAMRGLARSRSLERLNMFWLDTITDRGIVYLKDAPRLKKLSVGHAKLTDTGLSNFADYENLDYLHLPKGFTDTGIRNLAGLKHLKFLWVNCNSGSPLTDKTLAIVSNLRGLEELYISGTGFTDKGIDLLTNLENLRTLNLMWFGSDGLDNENLKQLTKLSGLKKISLGRASNITISGLNTLSALDALENLSVDDVRRDEGVLDISGLKKLKNLKIGMLSKTTKIGGEYVTNYEFFRNSDIACLSGLTNIENLNLIGYGVGDNGFKHLAPLTKLKYIQIMGGNDLTDEGLKHLANMRRLDSLSIYSSRITPRGLEYLYPLKTLHIIRIKSTVPINGFAISRLRTELPHLQILDISQPESASRAKSPKPGFQQQSRPVKSTSSRTRKNTRRRR